MDSPKYVEERSKVLLGNLPEDFLRVNDPNQANCINGPAQPTQIVQRQYMAPSHNATQITICIIQAQLTKNYSLTKMDPYVRVRIGHSVFETHSDMRGGKFPNWNKTITSYLPAGIKTIHIEVFDEKTLTPDERIAYTDYVIPDEGLQGKFLDTWVPLSGKQGVDKEGSINITVCIRSVPYWSSVPAASPLMVVPQATPGVLPYYLPGSHMSVQYQQPMQNPNYGFRVAEPPQPYRPSEEEIKQVQEMFPDYDREVILSILENCRGNKEEAITALLSLSDK